MNSRFEGSGFPPLPQPISIREDQPELVETNDHSPSFGIRPLPIPSARFLPKFPSFRSLRQGCYLARWNMGGASGVFDGTIRVQREFTNTIASGDLYWSPPRLVVLPNRGLGGFGPNGGFGRWGWPGGFKYEIVNQQPDPSAGIPIFPRSRYRYYLRITNILEFITIGNSFQLGFQRWRYDTISKAFSDDGVFSAQMTWSTPPSGYPSGAQYLSGEVKDASAASVGTLSMGWVSANYRKATLEVDRYNASEYPSDNGAGVTWNSIFDQVGWELNVYESDTNLSEPSGSSWSDAELHARMLAKRDSANLDSEWRYHLICVRNLDSTSRGIMYDAYGGDSNNIPREGAAISSHWTIPNTATWGSVRGQRFGSADAPYFRTAVHEIGHAMGLYHNTADTGFMNTTGTIANAAAPGTFPANIKWGYADDDLKRLRHMPDPWVRPGMIPFGQAYGSVPLSPNDQLLDAPGWELSVNPLIDCVPLGAPVRVELKLTNVGEIATPVPESLGFKAGHVRGRVIDAAGNVRSFSPLVRCIEEHEVSTLEPEHSLRHSLTLLRGAQGALFGSPGLHTIEVEVALEAGNMKIGAVGQAQVMIEAPLTDSHSRAAMKLLSTPDVLLTLAIGGDHMTEGLEAIQDALKDKTLQPHFAWIEAKRLGRASGKRKADLQSACKQLSKDTICSLSEARRLEKLLKGATPEEKLSAPVKAVTDFLGSLLVRFEKELEVSPMGSDHKGKSKPAKKETAKS